MKLIFLFFFSFLLVVTPPVSSQEINELSYHFLPDAVSESSGLTYFNGEFITLNDSGNDQSIFFINSTGKLLKKVLLTNCKNVDWEDLAVDPKGTIYIGDFGNNMNRRKNLCVYKINYNQLDQKPEQINFSLSDQDKFPPSIQNRNFDLEAMIYFKDSLYLFSKNNTKPYNGYVKCYSLTPTAGTQIAQLKDSVFLGGDGFYNNTVTSADYDFKNNRLYLLCYRHLYIFWDFNGNNFLKGKFMKLNFGWLTQKESVCVVNDEIFISDEKQLSMGGKLHRYEVESYFKGIKEFKSEEIKSLKINKKNQGGTYLLKLTTTLNNEIKLKAFIPSQPDLKLELSLLPSEKGKINYEIKNFTESNCIVQLFSANKLIYSNRIENLIAA